MIERVIEQRRRNLGGGLDVGGVLPFAVRRMVGPQVFVDPVGQLDLASGRDRSVDLRPRPHIGEKAGRMKLPDADDAEFNPLPDDPAPPATSAS